MLKRCLFMAAMAVILTLGVENASAQNVKGRTVGAKNKASVTAKNRKSKVSKTKPKGNSQYMLPYMEQSAIVKKAKTRNAASRRSSQKRNRSGRK